MIGWLKKKKPQETQQPLSLGKAQVEDVNATRLILQDPATKAAFKAVLGAYRQRILKELETAQSEMQILSAQARLAFLAQLDDLPKDINTEMDRFRRGEGSWLITR